jgi:hypothetical protein
MRLVAGKAGGRTFAGVQVVEIAVAVAETGCRNSLLLVHQ